MQTTTFVSIGLNRADTPLPLDEQGQFVSQVRALLRSLPDAVFHFIGQGAGEWNGSAEQSVTFVVGHTLHPLDTLFHRVNGVTLNEHFVGLAKAHGQECIAVTSVDARATNFVGP
jgi:hypothetical protein